MSPVVRNQKVLLASAMVIALFAEGCRLVSGIFKAGVWVGIVGLILALALIGGVLALFKRA